MFLFCDVICTNSYTVFLLIFQGRTDILILIKIPKIWLFSCFYISHLYKYLLLKIKFHILNLLNFAVLKKT